MLFNPDNPIMKLCAKGIDTEGTGNIAAARVMYNQAWEQATNHVEWFTAAHYLARNNNDLQEQLRWNDLSLQHALKVEDADIRGTLPSLYLNLGKSYEDLGNIIQAKECYIKAAENIRHLKEDGYGRMIGSGIMAALERVKIPIE